MLKVFLVEDEYVVREGIKNIDWNAHGYEFCGEASDGEIALPLIRKAQPDIVITDIKMPFMDGLELAGQIRKEYPDIEIIILSGYEEFGFAQEAISLGVSKYLTKPIGAQDLLKEMDEIREAVEQKKLDKEISLRYQRDMEEDTIKNRKEFFNELVSGNSTVSELLARSDNLGLDLRASVYCILLCTSYIDTQGQDEYEISYHEMYTRLHEWAESRTDIFIMFNRDIDGMAVLFKADDPETLKKNIEVSCREFVDIVSGYDHIRYYSGIGCPVKRLSELGRSFDVASAAYAHRYFDKTNRIVNGEDSSFEIVSENGSGEEDIELGAIDARRLDREGLIHFIKTGDRAECDYFVDEFIDNACGDALQSMLFRQYVTMDVYFAIVDFVTGLGYGKDSIEAPDAGMNVASSVDTVRDYCKSLLLGAIDMRETVSHSKYKDVTDNVIRYIEEHYADEDLSLNILAEYVRFSPNHLSMIFSQETGETFSKYLIEYRIGKAKEALKCTSLKSSEIAMQVGYRDPHYFSYMFKKVTGMTPTQYREGK
ncbi:MAG: response regulator [Lachnospiraceae bacterium]|nr:response regulator [Lachnospiraceae bacterium]